jgi:hypothetical protein
MNSQRVHLCALGAFLLFSSACVDPKTRSKVERQSEQTASTLRALQEELKQEEENIERLKKEIELAEEEYRKSHQEDAYVVMLPDGKQTDLPKLPSATNRNSLQKIWFQDSIVSSDQVLPLNHLVEIEKQNGESLKNWMSLFVTENSMYTTDYFIRFMQFSAQAISTAESSEEPPVDLYLLIQPHQIDRPSRAFRIRGLFNPESKLWGQDQEYTYLLLRHGLKVRRTDTLWIKGNTLKFGTLLTATE